MKQFLDDNFLLQTDTAEMLYHEFARDLPIIDYHCHLPPDEIAANRQFDNLTKIWLDGDHYKWRAMRANGVPEEFCTGKASDEEKFMKWAETVPYTLRNPLYHWTHLELRRYFGITEVLDRTTALRVYREAGTKLNSREYSVQNLLRKMNVAVICTTDDPADSLEHHAKIKTQKFAIKILPTWRPDKSMAAEDPASYNAYIDRLAAAADIDITDYSSLVSALRKRQLFFNSMGCRLSDHGIEVFYAEDFTEAEAETIFSKVRSGKNLEAAELLKLKSALLHEFAVMDHELGWTQQFHIGALRNNNSRAFRNLGPDKGYDSIGDFEIAKAMSKFLDRLDSTDQLAKTIIYNLNPRDNELIATMTGNFADGRIAGKMQFGSGWWFLDQKDGMEKQMNALSSLGLLSRFVGMLTDSRSFMSYPRHEYFRRILCNLIGRDVENGEIPNDVKLLGKTVQDICYFNAKEYFGF
jgi:glucuronate isomerase